MSGPRGSLYAYATYNTTTEKYDTTKSYNWNSVTAGYYLTDKASSASTCTANYRYYHSNLPCPEGSYCPGAAAVSCSSANPLNYTATLGLNNCETDTTYYASSAEGADKIGKCYLTTTATKYVASAGEGEVSCAAGGYCPGGTVVYYNTDGGSATGGRTTCPAHSYCVAGVAAASSCATTNAKYTKSAEGSDDANDCYMVTTSTKYVKAAGAGEVTCEAGAYCAGGSTIYVGGSVSGRSTTGGISVCAANKYSNAGASSCSSCATTNGYGNSGSAYSAHAGVTSCKVTCSGGTYVATSGGACGNVGAGYYAPSHVVSQTVADTNRGTCPTGLTTIGYGTGADESGDCGRILHVGENHLYLRSDKKTTPSLNVKIGDTVFYGNMATSNKNMSNGVNKSLKMKYGNTTYSVHDDSAN
jgi:hypothetical protein